jgi:hypothetical protein
MKIHVSKITGPGLMQRAAAMTTDACKSGLTLSQIYKCKHSPIRTQLFWIEMQGIPTSVSVHFVRHNVGVSHFVQSRRPDRTKLSGVADRNTPVNHAMLVNAEALINMSHKRLCNQASLETRQVMQEIAAKVWDVDNALSVHLVPMCVYLNGQCPELKSCGRIAEMWDLYTHLEDSDETTAA